jgi:hypothetical protein
MRSCKLHIRQAAAYIQGLASTQAQTWPQAMRDNADYSTPARHDAIVQAAPLLQLTAACANPRIWMWLLTSGVLPLLVASGGAAAGIAAVILMLQCTLLTDVSSIPVRCT